jgi:AcrR family transcriptional regulator
VNREFMPPTSPRTTAAGPARPTRDERERRARRRSLRASASEVYRSAILDAAERVFGRAGFEAAKMTAIGREAGIAAGTIYNYFDSKQRLFRSLVELRGEELLERLAEVRRTSADARGRLDATLREIFGYFDDHRSMFGLLAELGSITGCDVRLSGGPPLERICERYVRALEAVVADAIDAGDLRADVPAADQAVLLSGMLNAVTRGWLAHERPGPLAGHARILVDVFLNGLGARR